MYISGKDIYSVPSPDVSFVSVPGRNGDVLIDNNRLNNVTVSYDVAFRNIKSRAAAIKLRLCSVSRELSQWHIGRGLAWLLKKYFQLGNR